MNSDKRKDKRYIDLFYQIYNDSKNSNLKLDESFKESLKIDTTDNIIKNQLFYAKICSCDDCSACNWHYSRYRYI